MTGSSAIVSFRSQEQTNSVSLLFSDQREFALSVRFASLSFLESGRDCCFIGVLGTFISFLFPVLFL
jgi:hypothetical protein